MRIDLKKEESCVSSFFYAFQRKTHLSIRGVGSLIVFFEWEHPEFEIESLHPKHRKLCLTQKLKIMDVLNTVIENSALQGMPKWYQALTLTLFLAIASIIMLTYYFLLSQGSDMIVRFSYWLPINHRIFYLLGSFFVISKVNQKSVDYGIFDFFAFF